MEIEIRGRKMILPVETVFDLDRNAAVWTFVFPEQIAGRETEKLSGWLAVKTNAEEKTVRVEAFREGTRFSVTLPAGLFQGATVAEVQFSLSASEFAWHTEIEEVNVVRCLDPLGDVEPFQPNEIARLENAIIETQEKVEGLLSGETPVGSAQKDGEGKVIALTYATKEEVDSLRETNERVYAKKEDVSRSIEQMEQNFVTKGEFSGAQMGNQQMFATKTELLAAQSEHENFATKGAVENLQNELMQNFATKGDLSGTAAGFAQTYATKGEVAAAQSEHENFATKGELAGEISALRGEATTLTDLKDVEDVVLSEECGNAALQEKQRVLDENSSWYMLDYAVCCAESETTGVSSVVILRNKLKKIKEKFQGINRPNVMVYTTNGKNPFFGTSGFDFVSGINYYYYTYSTSEVTAAVKIKNCQNINLHGFVMTGNDYMDSALQLINCANVRVERCALINKGKGAVTLDGARDILIEDCAVYGSGYQSTAEITVKDTSTNETSITFRHCRLKDNGFGALNASGVTNANLSIVLDHVYYTDGRKVSTADCVNGSA
ncbi:MAG: right-handed parallel beta-helix repeat-containing protein [Clostridia bacterium]|nr:right-handed parallel beta-helix repeat-containing protein [Clostridia bacterium]